MNSNTQQIDAQAANDVDSVTLLACEPGHRAAKLFRDDPHGDPEDYDAGALFRARAYPVNSLADLGELIDAARKQPRLFIVHGRVKSNVDWHESGWSEPVPRRKYDRPECRAAFETTSHHWLVLDFDPSNASTLAELRSSLPSWLRNAECLWYPSAKAHQYETLRGKLFVWCTRPIDESEAARIAENVGADPSLYRTVQPIYIADPIFENCEDPADRKVARLPGEAATPPALSAPLDLDNPKLLAGPRPGKCSRGEDREAWARVWCLRAPVSVEGAKGHDDLFNVACDLVRGLGLDPDVARDLIVEHFNPRCKPPWSDSEINHKIEQAQQCDREPGYLLEGLPDEIEAVFSPEGIHERCAGKGQAWFEDKNFLALARLSQTDALRYARVLQELKEHHVADLRKLEQLVGQYVREQSKREPAPAHSIIAFEGRAWVADGKGGYHAPVKRSDLLARLTNLGRDDLIVGDERSTWRFNVTVATKRIWDFGQRELAKWEEPETIVTGCPLPAIEPSEDPDVDRWLRAMFGPGYDAACQWIAVCTPEHAHKPSAALVIVGPTSGGKTFLARCLARLWGAAEFVSLKAATHRFNGACQRTPVWCDDECVHLQSGEITSEEFVELAQRTVHDIELKGQERTVLRGAPRLVLLCNDIEQVAFGSTLGFEALRALEGRLSVHDFTTREAEVLAALNALRLPDSDLCDVARVLGHLRWIQAETAVERARFAGAYGANGSARVALGSVARRHPEVFEALAEGLANGAWWLLTEDDGGRLVYPSGLADALDVKLGPVQAALRAVTPKAERKIQKPLRAPPGTREKNVATWRLAPDFVESVISDVGSSDQTLSDVGSDVSNPRVFPNTRRVRRTFNSRIGG